MRVTYTAEDVRQVVVSQPMPSTRKRVPTLLPMGEFGSDRSIRDALRKLVRKGSLIGLNVTTTGIHPARKAKLYGVAHQFEKLAHEMEKDSDFLADFLASQV